MTRSSHTDHLLRSISLLCASYRGGADFIEKFRALARRFDGVDEVLVLAAGEERSQHRPGNVFTSAPVRVMGEVVGELQVFIRISSFRDSSPLPLTKFLAGQLGMALQFGGIHSSRRALEGHLAQFETEVREHKILERARGLMASRKLIPGRGNSGFEGLSPTGT
jgi:hypothetical protein